MNLLEKIKKLLEQKFEDFNFRINSDGWKRITSNGFSYLENKEKDIWESIDGYRAGEQLFTWNAAMRETKKAGKRMPTDKEFSILLKTKEDMKNLVFTGFHNTDGNFYHRDTNAYFWSSSQRGANAWNRHLSSSYDTVYRITNSKAYGFSVRCIKTNKY
jgi:hypothetical protein